MGVSKTFLALTSLHLCTFTFGELQRETTGGTQCLIKLNALQGNSVL